MEAEFIQVMRHSQSDANGVFANSIPVTGLFATSNSIHVTTKNVNNKAGWSLTHFVLSSASLVKIDMPWYNSSSIFSNIYIVRLNISKKNNGALMTAIIDISNSQNVTVLDEMLFSSNVPVGAGTYPDVPLYRKDRLLGASLNKDSGEKVYIEWVVLANQKNARMGIKIYDYIWNSANLGASIQIKRYTNLDYDYEDYYGLNAGTKTFGPGDALTW